jgi:hypothetical protein
MNTGQKKANWRASRQLRGLVDADCCAYLIHSDGDGVPPITAVLADDSYWARERR